MHSNVSAVFRSGGHLRGQSGRTSRAADHADHVLARDLFSKSNAARRLQANVGLPNRDRRHFAARTRRRLQRGLGEIERAETVVLGAGRARLLGLCRTQTGRVESEHERVQDRRISSASAARSWQDGAQHARFPVSSQFVQQGSNISLSLSLSFIFCPRCFLFDLW